jgi:hypothetical protein
MAMKTSLIQNGFELRNKVNVYCSKRITWYYQEVEFITKRLAHPIRYYNHCLHEQISHDGMFDNSIAGLNINLKLISVNNFFFVLYCLGSINDLSALFYFVTYSHVLQASLWQHYL